jgi:hypothetical protein
MTRNVTLRMDESLLAELRHRAVDARMSLSAWIAATLEALVPRTSDVEAARTRAIARMERGFHLGGAVTDREALHDR